MSDRKVMSARGEIVDFDRELIKSQLENAPKTEDIIVRERFVDKKRRKGKGTGRTLNEMLKSQVENEKYVAESLAKSKIDKELVTTAVTQAKDEVITEENIVEITSDEVTAVSRYARKKKDN